MHKSSGAYLGGLDHLRQSIHDILTTRPGTRVMRRDYGCEVWRFVDAPTNPRIFGQMYGAIAEALDRWEPRFQLLQVNVESVDTQGRVSFYLQGRVLNVPGLPSVTVPAYSLDDLRALQSRQPQSTVEDVESINLSALGQLLWIHGELPVINGRIAILKHKPVSLETTSLFVNGQKLLAADLSLSERQLILPYEPDEFDVIELTYLAENNNTETPLDNLSAGQVIAFSGVRLQ